jgi:hypothetical protein
MKQITKFRAYNGREFTSADKCLNYEARCKKADKAIARLGKPPHLPGCGFENGEGYLQHKREVFLDVRATLLRLAMQESDHKWLKQSLEDPNVDPSWAGRVIGEGCNEQLDKAWQRISCTDAMFREWGQPYYRTHPTEAKQVQIN